MKNLIVVINLSYDFILEAELAKKVWYTGGGVMATHGWRGRLKVRRLFTSHVPDFAARRTMAIPIR
jgi:hypothetical protein